MAPVRLAKAYLWKQYRILYEQMKAWHPNCAKAPCDQRLLQGIRATATSNASTSTCSTSLKKSGHTWQNSGFPRTPRASFNNHHMIDHSSIPIVPHLLSWMRLNVTDDFHSLSCLPRHTRDLLGNQSSRDTSLAKLLPAHATIWNSQNRLPLPSW